MTIGGVIFGLAGFCLYMLGGRVRTVFLYVMFTLCVEVLASAQNGDGFKHFAIWSGNTFLYAAAIAQNARDCGSVGKIGMWWWMLRYAAYMAIYTRLDWRMCWQAARIAVDDDPYWLDDTPKEAVMMELSYWSD